MVRTMDEVAARGVPHGGMLEGSKRSCLPYEFEPCEHPCQVPGVAPAACPATCADGSELDVVKPKTRAYTCPSGDWACIASEIMTYGSVAVTFGSVHEDFYDYASGVYRVAEEDRRESGLGQHATKLIGWGFERDDPYWIMVNSWENWGDRRGGTSGGGGDEHRERRRRAQDVTRRGAYHRTSRSSAHCVTTTTKRATVWFFVQYCSRLGSALTHPRARGRAR